jgi:isopenicillin-N N-acyltransferase like protein
MQKDTNGQTGLRVVHLTGSAREIGRAHGEELRAAIGLGLGRWFEEIESSASMAPEAYIASLLAATDFGPAIEKHAPSLTDEVGGISEGAGQPYDVMLAYQLMDEDWWYRIGLVRDRSRPVEACSAVGVEKEDGTTILAQNMDLPSHYDGTQVVLHLRPAGRPEALVFAPAGMIGSTGLNRHGVAVCCNSLTRLRHNSTGLPVAFVIREILACDTLEAATEMVRAVPHASGQNYLIGAPGSLADLECSAGQVREVRTDGSQVMHTNHALANDDIDPGAGLESGGRSTTFPRLAKLHTDLDPLGRGATVEDVQRTLSDREVPVCVARGQDWMTLGSLVMELSAEPALHIAPGPPADTPYSTIRFS